MTDRPILFSGPMVRAMLASTKTQTRRVLNPQPEHLQVYDWKGKRLHDSEYRHWCWKGHVGADNWDDITKQLAPFLPFAAGDRLYVREEFSGDWQFTGLPPSEWGKDSPIWYWADGNPTDGDWTKPKPGMHMPRWASRLTLTVTDVRVQRLQDINEVDAWAEGVQDCGEIDGGRQISGYGKALYASLWNSLNADRAGGAYAWKANPWVVAVSFSVIHQNIDQVAA
ncbi:conserved hypothetical protein [Mesorhizobium plurifarium]|uniref:Morphogenetic protein n=1 Tax=Mesorhizobium plurifarium TaxID=69974 RepID=A0A090EG05_MESPL|nr:conserved hypothetical protein [Mesorhizobium plurifarium]